MSNNGKIIIDSNSFVGLGARSRAGCLACRQRKKKCDEVHPTCGVCLKYGRTCEWTNKPKNKYNFNLNTMIESQNQLKKVKSESLKKDQSNKKMKSNTSKISKVENIKIVTKKIQGRKKSPKVENPIVISPKEDDIDIEKAVDEIMDDANKMDDFISKVVEHIKSPGFNPVTNIVDLSLSSAIKHAQSYLSKQMISSPSASPLLSCLFSPSQFMELRGEEKENRDVEHLSLYSSTSTPRIVELNGLGDDVVKDEEEPEKLENHGDNVGSSEELDVYAPMDESQLLENLYISDSDLIKVFKSKELHPYLRPTVHLLLSKNNTLKIMNPSSPILKQLDTTGKMFLENYVTNLAMNQLDIGNSQFFLDYALSQASTDPAILYCLVAWGGMFLVGRDNTEASKYTTKSFELIEEKKEKLSLSFSGFDNEENLKLLLFYVLFQCAEISTGDVNRWFQMLLQSKDIFKKYGGLRQFLQINKNSKVARWILSNVFYHDVMCTRTVDYGTVIPIHEYQDVFNCPMYLEDLDYGLDPFYGLSQNLYLILGEVANNRRKLKNSRFPLNFEASTGLSSKVDEKTYKEIEESWFQIFDSQITTCQPPPDKVELLLKKEPDGKLWEHHLTWYELTQTSLRIYIRINFKETEFDDSQIQRLREKGMILFNVLIGTKLQSLLGLPILMLGITSIVKKDRERLAEMYSRLLKNYEILNIRVCWEIIRVIWDKYDKQVQNGGKHYVDWPEIVNAMGWNCCFT